MYVYIYMYIYIYVYMHIGIVSLRASVLSPFRSSWTRTLLGGLWNVHNSYETCTTSMERAQLLWNVRNSYETCATSMIYISSQTLQKALNDTIPIHIYTYEYGHNVFHRPHPVFSSILYVHVSEMLCTFHKPPNNLRVQLHWGDQTRSPDILSHQFLSVLGVPWPRWRQPSCFASAFRWTSGFSEIAKMTIGKKGWYL